ncbi:MAG: YhcH/YjgK/YiaL family protein [Bacteroidales bacterium]|nr:YhcH/YjgK/YiaL family protein [Bacteroidales bacterium]
MILTTLANSERVESLHPAFKKVFDYVKTHDLLHAPIGRIELEGKEVYINNDDATLRPADKAPLEYHTKYIDIQILLEGDETLGWKSVEEIEHVSQPYNEATDMTFSDDKPTNFMNIKPGQAYILFPEDAHAPIIGEGKVRKLVCKIKI